MAVFLALIAAFAMAVASPICIDNLAITVVATAKSLLVPASLNMTSYTKQNGTSLIPTIANLPWSIVAGTYTIRGRYCEPEDFNILRRNTLQLLVHGAGYDHTYWSGLATSGNPTFNPSNYSWVDYASKQGYPTFSVDRVCNGQSSHPAGINCQLPLNAAILDQVILQLRLGSIAALRPFTKFVWVGHSIGSVVGAIHARNYPKSADGYILTAFSAFVANGSPGTVVASGLQPAAQVKPQMYGNLDSNYLMVTNRTGFELAFYRGQYDRAVVDFDFAHTGTPAVGELVSILEGQIPALTYAGPVMVLTGRRDFIFCSTSVQNFLAGLPADCGSGDMSLVAQTSVLFPKAKVFQPVVVQNTGHDVDLHISAQQSFQLAHQFLADHSL